jgi:hypothetical protein
MTVSKKPVSTKMPKSAEGHQALNEGRFSDAEIIFREIAAQVRSLFGGNHVEMAIALEGLSKALDGQGKQEEALKYQEQASQIFLRNAGHH